MAMAKPLAQLAAIERYEALARDAHAAAAEMAVDADDSVEHFESLFTSLAAAEEEASRAEAEAQETAKAAAEAAAEAERLAGIAKAAREDGPVVETFDCPVPGRPRSALWDIQVAIHCVRPTGKGQRKTHKLHAAIARARVRSEDSITALERTTEELEAARAEVARLEGVEAQQTEDKADAEAWLAMLLDKQKAEEAGRHIFTIPHTPASTKEAWLRVLQPLREAKESVRSPVSRRDTESSRFCYSLYRSEIQESIAQSFQ